MNSNIINVFTQLWRSIPKLWILENNRYYSFVFFLLFFLSQWKKLQVYLKTYDIIINIQNAYKYIYMYIHKLALFDIYIFSLDAHTHAQTHSIFVTIVLNVWFNFTTDLLKLRENFAIIVSDLEQIEMKKRQRGLMKWNFT